jgi:hypothetical protein
MIKEADEMVDAWHQNKAANSFQNHIRQSSFIANAINYSGQNSPPATYSNNIGGSNGGGGVFVTMPSGFISMKQN